MDGLKNKVAVITGGSRGLGLAIAVALAREGVSVVIASRSQKSVDEAVAQLRALGANADGMAMDVARLDQVEALCAFALERLGRMDVWVNNAGTAGPYGATLGITPQDFTQSLAAENRASGVGVFAFNPGMVLTELLTHVDVVKGSEERLKNFGTIVRMWARPPEIPAQKVAWIASSATDGKTGQLINIFSPWDMITGAVKEGLRSLSQKPADGPDIQIRSIDPYTQ